MNFWSLLYDIISRGTFYALRFINHETSIIHALNWYCSERVSCVQFAAFWGFFFLNTWIWQETVGLVMFNRDVTDHTSSFFGWRQCTLFNLVLELLHQRIFLTCLFLVIKSDGRLFAHQKFYKMGYQNITTIFKYHYTHRYM